MDAKKLILSGFENIERSMNRTLDGMSADELNWHPHPDTNSIAQIIFHCARSQDGAQARLQGKPQLWESSNWYEKLKRDKGDIGGHYTDEQVAAFKIDDIKSLLEYEKETRGQLLDALQNAPAARMDEKIVMPAPPPPPKAEPGRLAPPRPPMSDFTFGSMMMMDVMHTVGHMGEISYLRGLKRGMDR